MEKERVGSSFPSYSFCPWDRKENYNETQRFRRQSRTSDGGFFRSRDHRLSEERQLPLFKASFIPLTGTKLRIAVIPEEMSKMPATEPKDG
jgi:hypothetical protein